MKKIALLIAVALLLLICITACAKRVVDVPQINNTPGNMTALPRATATLRPDNGVTATPMNRPVVPSLAPTATVR